MDSLYISDNNPLSDTSFPSIFSHSAFFHGQWSALKGEGIRQILQYSTGEVHGPYRGVTESDTTKQLPVHSLNASAFPSPSVKLPMCRCQQAKACTRIAMPLLPLSCQPVLAMSGSYWLLGFMPGLSHSQAISFWIKPAGRHASSLATYICMKIQEDNYLGLSYTHSTNTIEYLLCFELCPKCWESAANKKENISYYTQWRGQALDQQVRYTVRKACDKRN